MTSHQPRASSLSRRPTTPLRRLSSSSLRSTSLSHSRSRGASSVEPPLAHLNPVFAELADALSDLAGNFEALDQVNATLDGFNEAFGSYLYSLRVNAYTVDFDEGPTPINLERQRERLREEREREAALTQQQQTHERRHAEDGEEDGEQEGNETTFVTHESEYSFMHREEEAPRGGGARGRGRGRGRGGKPVGMTRRQKEVMLAFSDSIIQLLPITFREQQPQRGATEKIISLLRENPGGVAMADFKKQIEVQPHRLNECLTALVRAKLVLKVVAKGVTTFTLDPAKYPPA